MNMLSESQYLRSNHRALEADEQLTQTHASLTHDVLVSGEAGIVCWKTGCVAKINIP
jgi:hypothetical protein